jgi:hypothetical protein
MYFVIDLCAQSDERCSLVPAIRPVASLLGLDTGSTQQAAVAIYIVKPNK